MKGLTLQKRALAALEKSTKMLEVAFELLGQGKESEAKKLRNEARTQRTISTLLMAEAKRQEIESTSFPSQRHEYRQHSKARSNH